MKRTRTFAACLLAPLFAPLPAAACPTAADLDTGVRVHSPDGSVETFTRLNKDVIVSEFRFEPGEGSRSLLAQGIYLIQINDVYGDEIDTKARTTYTYTKLPGTLPVPTPGGAWNTRVVILDEDGLGTERQQISFGQAGTRTIGACSYDTVPITVVYPDDDYSETLEYLPELGLAILTSAQDVGAEADVYSFERIEAVK